MTDFAPLAHYLDPEGRLKEFPGRRKKAWLQQLALVYLAEKIAFEQDYTERQINEVLNTWHTFGDPAMLRRELFERGFLGRERNGSRYWRTQPAAALPDAPPE